MDLFIWGFGSKGTLLKRFLESNGYTGRILFIDDDPGKWRDRVYSFDRFCDNYHEDDYFKVFDGAYNKGLQ